MNVLSPTRVKSATLSFRFVDGVRSTLRVKPHLHLRLFGQPTTQLINSRVGGELALLNTVVKDEAPTGQSRRGSTTWVVQIVVVMLIDVAGVGVPFVATTSVGLLRRCFCFSVRCFVFSESSIQEVVDVLNVSPNKESLVRYSEFGR